MQKRLNPLKAVWGINWCEPKEHVIGGEGALITPRERICGVDVPYLGYI